MNLQGSVGSRKQRKEEAGPHQEEGLCVATAGALKPPCGPDGDIVGLQKDKLGSCGSWGDLQSWVCPGASGRLIRERLA